MNFGLKYSKEGPPKKAFEEDIEHRVSLPSSLVISGSFFHHLMLLLRLIQIDHLIAHSDLFKRTYIQLYYEMLNGNMFCRFTSILFRIQT